MIKDKRQKPLGSTPKEAGKLGADVAPAGELGSIGDLDDAVPPDDGLPGAGLDPSVDRKKGTAPAPEKPTGDAKAREGAASSPPIASGRIKFPPRVLIVPPSSVDYPAEPGRTRHPVQWEAFDAATGERIAGDADEGSLRKLVLDAGSQVV